VVIKLSKKLLATLTLVIVCIVILCIVLPAKVLANPGLEVIAPSAIALGSLYGTTGDVTGAAGTPGTVLSTDSGYTLKITSSDPEGKMSLDGLGVTDLATALKVTAALIQNTGAPVTTGSSVTGVPVLTTSDLTVGATSAPSAGVNNITLSVAQPKQTTGTTGGYSITLTFTATAN
jgi:hypothetical protein